MEDTSPFNKTITQLEALFRFAGIHIRIGITNTTDRFKARCLYFLHSFAANYNLFCNIIWCVNGMMNGKDFLGIAISAPCIIISVLAQFKGLLLIKHEDKAKILIDCLKKLEDKYKHRPRNQEKKEMVNSEVKFLNFVLKTLNIFYFILVAGFSISPLVLILVEYVKTKIFVPTLPFFALYGYDPFQRHIWPFIYIFQCWSELAVVLNICSADYLFFTCCTYIRIQFKLLEHDLQNIIPIEKHNYKMFVDNENFKQNFNEIIKRHQDLIESANILEIIYSKSTLLNFFSSSLIICLTGFNLTILHDGATISTFLSFLFLCLVQVYFVCFFADLLMTSSMGVGNGVYNSQMYLAEAKIGKNMVMILNRSQKPCKITASGYADVNLKSFMRVLSTAYSYFALLRTMFDD